MSRQPSQTKRSTSIVKVIENSAKRLIREYSSFADFAEFAKGADNDPEANAMPRSSVLNSADKWNGYMTFEQACHAGIYGDAECLKKVEDVRCRIKTIRGDRSLKCKPVYAVTGASIDIGRMLAGGDPRCFRSWRRQITTQPGGKIVRLIINNAYSAETATGDIMRRGAAICALIDAYETAGFRCDVVLVYTNLVYTKKTKISRMEDRITLKRAEQPLDLDAMAFALVHPAAF